MADIFFSYADLDRARVEPLIEALKAQGWTVWLDTDLLAGERLQPAIRAALDGARCVVVAWSKLSMASDWVLDEADVARRKSKLIPIWLDSEDNVPLGFRGIIARDFSKWAGDRRAPEFLQLCASIQKALGEPNSPPPPPPPPPGRFRKVTISVIALLIAGVAIGVFMKTPAAIGDDEWSRPPDRGYCFQRDHKVAEGQFIARCFQTSKQCSDFKDMPKVTSCAYTTGLLALPAWSGAKTGYAATWFRYSESDPFPLPFPQDFQ